MLTVYDDEGWNIAPPSPRGGITYADASFFVAVVSAPNAVVVAATGRHVETTTRYGPYPYNELDFVAIPTLALGIEYPGLIAHNRDLYDSAAEFTTAPVQVLLESTTAHEVGHQWFYNLVGNDQMDELWLDDALTQYATWRSYADPYGPDGEAGFGAALDGRWAHVDHAPILIALPVSDYNDAEYGAIVHGRGLLFFDALAEQIGEPALEGFLRDYAQRFRWGIATDADLKAVGETFRNYAMNGLFAEWVWN